MEDLLFVSFEKSARDPSGMCVSRKHPDGDITVLKMEVGEQADILYQLLTEQMTKAEIKTEGEIHCNCTDKEIAKSFIEDVEAVKDLLPRAESEE